MKCAHPGCNAELYPGDRFCGACGRPVSTQQQAHATENASDLFPLYGVTLGETTTRQLAQLGQRARLIDKNTGAPYQCYVIHGIDFWYDKAGIAESMYLVRSSDPIPEQWRTLSFDWEISYNQWLILLQRLGYSITVKVPPHVVKYSGHDSLSAKITATKQTHIPVKIELDFNYSEGTKTDSKGTLYSIRVSIT
jgi:hypothetical protein